MPRKPNIAVVLLFALLCCSLFCGEADARGRRRCRRGCDCESTCNQGCHRDSCDGYGGCINCNWPYVCAACNPNTHQWEAVSCPTCTACVYNTYLGTPCTLVMSAPFVDLFCVDGKWQGRDSGNIHPPDARGPSTLIGTPCGQGAMRHK